LLIFVYLLSVFTMSILVALSNTLGTFSQALGPSESSAAAKNYHRPEVTMEQHA
jgi:hypothetical protein